MLTLSPRHSVVSAYSGYQRPQLGLTVSPLMTRPRIYNSDTIDLKPTPTPDVPATTAQTQWYNKPGVRVAGMMAGGAAVMGTAGYFVGRSLGAAGVGAAVGAGVGIVAPIAMVAFALWQWGRKH